MHTLELNQHKTSIIGVGLGLTWLVVTKNITKNHTHDKYNVKQ